MKKFITLFLLIFISVDFAFSLDLTVAGSFPGANWQNNNSEYKMTQIGETGVYKLTKTLPAGNYEYKVFETGTWNGPSDTRNRQFTLSEEKEVNFYAKSTNQFVCSAQQLYMIGTASGGWGDNDRKSMTMTSTGAIYTFSTGSNNTEYKIINLHVNNNVPGIVWNDVTPANQSIGDAGNYTVTLDISTFGVSVQRNVEGIHSSYVFIGSNPSTATFYKCSAVDAEKSAFNGINLGARKTLEFGGEVKTNPIIGEGINVKAYYQINEMGVHEINIPWEKNDNGNSVWKNTEGINILSGHSLTDFQEYDLKVWFAANTGNVTVYDSNESDNYVARFTYDSTLTGTSDIQNNYRISTNNGNLKVFLDEIAHIELYTITGQLISSKDYDNVFLQTVQSGIYMLRINGKTHKVVVP
ncbi:hypothetical protein MASR2M117_08910 [Paludibacter sp.]